MYLCVLGESTRGWGVADGSIGFLWSVPPSLEPYRESTSVTRLTLLWHFLTAFDGGGGVGEWRSRKAEIFM